MHMTYTHTYMAEACNMFGTTLGMEGSMEREETQGGITGGI